VAIESGVNVIVVGRTQEKCIATKTKISTGLARSAKRKFADSAEVRNPQPFPKPIEIFRLNPNTSKPLFPISNLPQN
jgi:hypothetical protein